MSDSAIKLKYVTSRITGDGMASEAADFISLDVVESWTGKRLETDGAEDRDLSGTPCHEGDILFGKLRPYLAKIHRVETDSICASEFIAMRPEPGTDSRFLRYLLGTEDFVKLVNSMSYGTKMPRVDPGAFLGIKLEIPPLPAQRSIATYLDSETSRIDSLIDRKKRFIDLLLEKRTALITQAVTKGLDPDVEMKDSGIEWIGDIPAHWQVLKLAWLTQCLDGRRIPVSAELRAEMPGSYPYWGAGSIVDHVGEYLFDETLVLLGEDGAPFFDPHRPVAHVVREKVWVNNHIHVLRPSQQVDPDFMAHALNSVDYVEYIDGSTRDKLTQGDMSSIQIPIPSREEQSRIVADVASRVGRIDRLTKETRDSIELLKEYRTALISAAVTGQIEIPAADSGEDVA